MAHHYANATKVQGPGRGGMLNKVTAETFPDSPPGLLPVHPHDPRTQTLPPASDTLWVVVSIEGGLQDASREDDFVLGWKVVSVHSLRCHAPPGGGRTRLRVLTLLMLPSLTAQVYPACLLQEP